ncbi:MAG: fumarate hydratase [Endomicrobia bacterium]|nr:fumarate hydratase [Endomicrobiia bacterium]MDW8055509.1 fumarate hydratase [Elusimicrobiota bacterium]
MREITKEQFVSAIRTLLVHANYFLPEDFLQAIKTAIETEVNLVAKDVLLKILNNAEISSITKLPLCQDTGIPQFFVDIGKDVCLNFDINATVQNITAEVYENEKLRCSCVVDPLKRTGKLHFGSVYIQCLNKDELDRRCKISVLIRGGGSENTSVFTNFLPTTNKEEIITYITETIIKLLPYTCPPVIVGIGVGGVIEESMILAKKSLLRTIGIRNKDLFYAEIEKQIKDAVNNSGIGPLGLGGKTSVLDVFIEAAPTHIATLPVSIVLQCHSYRKHTVVL